MPQNSSVKQRISNLRNKDKQQTKEKQSIGLEYGSIGRRKTLKSSKFGEANIGRSCINI